MTELAQMALKLTAWALQIFPYAIIFHPQIEDNEYDTYSSLLLNFMQQQKNR